MTSVHYSHGYRTGWYGVPRLVRDGTGPGTGRYGPVTAVGLGLGAAGALRGPPHPLGESIQQAEAFWEGIPAIYACLYLLYAFLGPLEALGCV